MKKINCRYCQAPVNVESKNVHPDSPLKTVKEYCAVAHTGCANFAKVEPIDKRALITETLTPEDEELKDVVLIWMEKNGKRVPAEIHSGPYVGTDGRIRFDNGSVYGLDSGVCFKVIGETYPFGTLLGGEVGYYVKNGATISLRKG